MRIILIILGSAAVVALAFGLVSLTVGSQILDFAHKLAGG